jgi:hypothetical protein
MRKTLLFSLFALVLALPAGAQVVQGILIEPRHPTTSDRIRLTVVGLPDQCRLTFFAPPVYEAATGTVVLNAAEAPECPKPDPSQPPQRYELEAGPLPAGVHFAEVRVKDLPGFNWRELFEVREDATPEIVIEPERPTAAYPVRVAVAVLNTEDDLQFDGLAGRTLLFHYNSYVYPASIPAPPYERITEEATVGPLAPGVYTVDVRQDSQHAFGRTFEVGAKAGQLNLRIEDDSYFTVHIHVDLPRNGVGWGVPLTSESGYFWFFDPDNVEITVKILDGRAVNGKYWVFIASMTDVGFTAEVEHCPWLADPPLCDVQLYRSEPGVNRNIIDVNFPAFSF